MELRRIAVYLFSPLEIVYVVPRCSTSSDLLVTKGILAPPREYGISKIPPRIFI